jgi:hypothetical protein
MSKTDNSVAYMPWYAAPGGTSTKSSRPGKQRAAQAARGTVSPKKTYRTKAEIVNAFLTKGQKPGICPKPRGRVINIGGKLVAQVAYLSGYRQASLKQSAAIFRIALAVARLQPGDEVIAWDGNRLVQGQYVEASSEEQHIFAAGSWHVLSGYVLPLEIAIEEGLWSKDSGNQQTACRIGRRRR